MGKQLKNTDKKTIISFQNELKLTYSNVEFQNKSGGYPRTLKGMRREGLDGEEGMEWKGGRGQERRGDGWICDRGTEVGGNRGGDCMVIGRKGRKEKRDRTMICSSQ